MLTDSEIVEEGNPRSAIFAFEDMKFLDDRHRRAQTFCGNLYMPGTDDGLVKFSSYSEDRRRWSVLQRPENFVQKGRQNWSHGSSGNGAKRNLFVSIASRGVLPYLSYTGTCRPSGYGFSTVRS